jgi:hypothetical protein
VTVYLFFFVLIVTPMGINEVKKLCGSCATRWVTGLWAQLGCIVVEFVSCFCMHTSKLSSAESCSGKVNNNTVYSICSEKSISWSLAIYKAFVINFKADEWLIQVLLPYFAHGFVILLIKNVLFAEIWNQQCHASWTSNNMNSAETGCSVWKSWVI